MRINVFDDFFFYVDFKIFSNLEGLYLGGNKIVDFVTIEGMRGFVHGFKFF